MTKNGLIQIRLSSEKKADWQLRARESGMSLSSWIEGCCDGAFPIGNPVNAPVLVYEWGNDGEVKSRSHHQTCKCQMCCK